MGEGWKRESRGRGGSIHVLFVGGGELMENFSRSVLGLLIG